MTYWQPKGLPVLPITPAPRLGRTPTSTTSLQNVLLGDAGAPDPPQVSVEVAEVMYRRGETGTFEPPLALVMSELLAFGLPLHEAKLGPEAFSLLVMMVVSLDFREQPPVWEGGDTVAEGEIG